MQLSHFACFLFVLQIREYVTSALKIKLCFVIEKLLVGFGIEDYAQRLIHCELAVVAHQHTGGLFYQIAFHFFYLVHSRFRVLSACSVPKKYCNVIPFMYFKFLIRVSMSISRLRNRHSWRPTLSLAMGPTTMSY